MSKRELIDEILSLNLSAHPAFLAQFDEVELREYLKALQRARVMARARAQADTPEPSRVPAASAAEDFAAESGVSAEMAWGCEREEAPAAEGQGYLFRP